MWVLIATFSDEVEEQIDDVMMKVFTDSDRRKAESEFDLLVADGEYPCIYLTKVITSAVRTYDIAEFADDDA
jgi:hypothetical protein